MHSKPGFIIWSSTIICVALAIAALSNTLAQTSEAARGQSLGILLVCSLAAATSVWRLIRLYRTAMEVADITKVPFGVPLRPSRGKAMTVAIGMLAIGAMPLITMTTLTPIIRGGAWLLVAGGVGMLAAVLARLVPVGQITLRADGLALAGRGLPIVLPWERISAVEGGEYGGNPAIFLWLDSPDTIAVPPGKHKAFMRQVAFCRNLMDADYYHPTIGYGVGLASLVAAIEHYRLQASGG
ncbi:hypothetical protein [Massilia aquatica]|uniref:Uncharacterized protein n=1 Tax=Massilia aquatica TaxID=2609000 RepID=A0ABX0MDK3_9BURK|nr:hypothetical protein [Massilia aquatica]NHZ42061.1 hypothetical protein [Massilia aquatica]